MHDALLFFFSRVFLTSRHLNLIANLGKNKCVGSFFLFPQIYSKYKPTRKGPLINFVCFGSLGISLRFIGSCEEDDVLRLGGIRILTVDLAQ